MEENKHGSRPLTSIEKEVRTRSHSAMSVDAASKSYPVAFADTEFMLRPELRPVRVQLELLKPELVLADHNVTATIVIFGSARLPTDVKEAEDALYDAEIALEKSPDDSNLQKAFKRAKNIHENCQYMREATKLAHTVVTAHTQNPELDFHIVTGGGPGFMEAANRGAYEANHKNIAFNIMLPHEQEPNAYVSPELTFQFHYFAIRKMHFFIRARALVAFPGGYGTLDELFDALTLIQTEKMDPLPILLFNEKFWRRIINFEALVDEGTISESDLNLFHYVETAEQAWQIILDHYGYSAHE